MKNYWFLAIVVFLFLACKKEQAAVVVPSNEVRFDLKLLARNEVPEGISLAEGRFVGVYNKTSKILSYTLSHQGLTPTAAHFHKGLATATGAIVLNIATANFASPLSAQTIALNTQQETDLLAEGWYVNVHSALYPNGEIRAQLIKTLQ